MKFCWRITKYDPRYRCSDGAYLNNEWSMYAEIGEMFDNILFHFKEYERIEDLYIKAIDLFMTCHKISALQVSTLEKNRKLTKDIHNNANMIRLFHSVKVDDWIQQTDIQDFCKLILRDKLWCKLKYNRKMFVHFGWDFYMYIGSSLLCDKTIAMIGKSGLFVEEFKSPYE